MLRGRKVIGTIAFMGGIPAVLTEFCRSWGKLVQYTMEYVCEANETVYLDDARVSFHSWARNSLVDSMRGDWLFMLDTDHSYDPDILGRLLHRMDQFNLDVICGLYLFKSAPHPPVLYGWHTRKNGEAGLCLMGGWTGPAHVVEVAGAGGGCLLVKRKVFDRIRDELHEKPFDVIGQGGEDLGFFHRLRRLEVKAYIDDRVECPHLMSKALTFSEDYHPSSDDLVLVDPATGLIEDKVI